METDLIRETLDYIKSIINNLERITVIVVGNIRERDASGQNPTLEIAKRHIATLPQFIVVEAPCVNASHAHQNNYALRIIKTPPETSWVLTLDIDSRFSLEGLQSMIHEINSGTPVIQQSALFLSNFSRLDWIQRGHAIYQSRWTIAHELKRIQLHNQTNWSLAHVVGHGLCIRLDTLLSFGTFPENTITEDIQLGFYLVAGRVPIKILPVFEIADTPNRFVEGLRQEYVWSFGAMNYPAYLKSLIVQHPNIWRKNRLRCLIIVIQALIAYVRWLLCSWVVIGIVIAATTGWFLAQLFLILYLIEFLQCGVFFFQKNLISIIDLFCIPFYGLVGVLRRSFGADVAAFRQCFGFRVVKHKTPHF